MGSAVKKPAPTMAERADRHLLYQASVQSPEFELDFIDKTFESLVGRVPRSMREDFCGTALSSTEWVRRRGDNTAVAIDIDPEVLDWARAHNLSRLSKKERGRLELVEGDVREVETARVDLVQAYNFSYWFFQERAELLAYFRRLRGALVDDGLLFLDVFGGSECYQTQKEKRKLEPPEALLGAGDWPRRRDGEPERFRYVWEQAAFNAITNELRCHIHFHFPDKSKLKKAFSYTWRVWGARELREVLAEAGFGEAIVYRQEFDEETDEALDEYVATDFAEDYACWLGYIVARP